MGDINGTRDSAQFNRPYKAAKLGKRLFITDFYNSSIQVLVLP